MALRVCVCVFEYMVTACRGPIIECGNRNWLNSPRHAMWYNGITARSHYEDVRHARDWRGDAPQPAQSWRLLLVWQLLELGRVESVRARRFEDHPVDLREGFMRGSCVLRGRMEALWGGAPRGGKAIRYTLRRGDPTGGESMRAGARGARCPRSASRRPRRGRTWRLGRPSPRGPHRADALPSATPTR